MGLEELARKKLMERFSIIGESEREEKKKVNWRVDINPSISLRKHRECLMELQNVKFYFDSYCSVIFSCYVLKSKG